MLLDACSGTLQEITHCVVTRFSAVEALLAERSDPPCPAVSVIDYCLRKRRSTRRWRDGYELPFNSLLESRQALHAAGAVGMLHQQDDRQSVFRVDIHVRGICSGMAIDA